MLMPSHAKNVKPYKEPEPVFIRYQVERQLAAMFSPQVVLKSGGYIVINQTEALVSIDVNSGKATREHNIEDTALKTNLEASEEIARQLRLRDLAGPHRDRLHRHGRAPQLTVSSSGELKESLAQRPRPHSSRAHQPFRLDGNVAPAPAARHARRLDQSLPHVPGHRHRALDGVDRARRAPLARGSSDHRRRGAARGDDGGRRRALHPQSEARPSEGRRAALPHADHRHGGRGHACLAVRHRARAPRARSPRRARGGAHGLGAPPS